MQMNNHSPKPKRERFTDLINTNPHAKQVLQRNAEGIQRLFANNMLFLSEANLSVYRQCKDITARTGFNLSTQYMSSLKLGKQLACSSYIIYLIADYWGLDGAEMLFKKFDCLPISS